MTYSKEEGILCRDTLKWYSGYSDALKRRYSEGILRARDTLIFKNGPTTLQILLADIHSEVLSGISKKFEAIYWPRRSQLQQNMLFVQQRGQFPIASSERLEWAEIGSLNFPENFQNMGVPRNRSHSSRISYEKFPGRNAFREKMTWTHLIEHTFPPFALITRILNKVKKEKATFMIIAPAWQTQ